MRNLPVLIIGAGPTGLMMACQLAYYGIDFKIIDKKPECTQASNATWIQSRTLELFDQMGIVDRFIKNGYLCEAINFYTDGKPLTKLPLKFINSIYPFILMLPQSHIEKILEEYLISFHHHIERNIELIDVKCEENTVTATLKHADGKIENINSDWLIACDGANSIVREKCGFHFPGEDLTEQFIVADATIDMPKDEIHYFFEPGKILAAFPLGSNKYRIAANLHLDYPRKFFSSKEIIDIVQERAHGKYYISDISWISGFWIHGKIAEHMRKDKIFLAGDAAHVHSPAGGQGMNTGIQDAFNLAWKLALVIQGKAKPMLLDSYENERYPIAQETIKQNEYFTKMALFDKNFQSILKNFSDNLSNDTNHLFAQNIGNQITQIDIQYKNSPIINKNSSYAGKRAPDVAINNNTLYKYFDNTLHNILLFTGLNPNQDELTQLGNIQKTLEQHAELFKVFIVSKEPIDSLNNVIVDSNADIHSHFNVTRPTIVIIRPDTYIAYYSDHLNLNLDAAELAYFLKL